MRNFRHLFLSLLTLGTLAAQADPEATAQAARQRYLAALPGTYRLEGFLGTQRLPRAQPDYVGTLVITRTGEQFELKYQWPGGGASGAGMLGPGRFKSSSHTEDNVQFQLSVGTLNARKQLGVSHYMVYPPDAGRSWSLEGPWRSGKEFGYERAIKNP